MALPLPRIIALLVAIQVLFVFVADHHIKTSFSSVTSGLLIFKQEEDNDRPSPRKKYHATISKKYTPDYTKFNTSLPPILYASSPESLPSLPEANRVPRRVLASKNFEEYYSNWTNGVSPHTLFVYNPSIIPLSLYAKKSSTKLQRPKNGLGNIQYLSSFRISSIHSCGFSTYEFWKYPVDYMGLALMNDDLTISTIIENGSREYNAADDDTTNNNESLDIIVDLNKHLPNIFGGRIKVQDVRLFILHDRVFMSSGLFLVPICVSIGDGLLDPPDRREYWASLLSSPAFCKQNDNATMVEVPALYRKNDRLHLYITGDAIRLKDADGKNFQFFHLRSNHTSQQNNESRVLGEERVLMEYYPYSPREVHDLGNEIAKQYAMGEPTTKTKRIINLKRIGEFNSAVAPDPRSKVSKSLDSSLRTFIKRDRSSACCVKIEQKYYRDMIHSLDPSIASELKKVDSILIGISHSKSRQRMPSSQGDRYNYLSRMYAFLPSEPFDLLARSGLFCFGFTGDNIDATGHRGGVVRNDYNELTKSKKLELNKVTYNCPNIHFVNSIIEKNGDSDILIVSYGVNDCVPRFVEISKQHFVTHLFSSTDVDKK